VRSKAKTMDVKKLKKSLQEYGSVKAKKLLESVITAQYV
jgi:hypothetical protein